MSSTPAPPTLVFDVSGMDCADCAKSVERVVANLPGVLSADVRFGTGTLSVVAGAEAGSDEQTIRAVTGAVDRAGYAAQVRTNGIPGRVGVRPWWQHGKLLPAAVAAVIWIAAIALQHGLGQEVPGITLFAAAIAIGGLQILRAALLSLLARRLDMNVLMSLSVIGAAVLGEWSEGALVVVLFSIGTTVQAITFDRTRVAIRALLNQAPEEAWVSRGGTDVRIAATDLVIGDVVRVRPGERIPADGTVSDGMSEVSQAEITGESMPIARSAGDPVFAGSINGAGSLQVVVTAPAANSMLARMVHLVEEAQGSKAASQQFVDRFAAVYTPVVVAVAAAVATGGWLLSDEPATWLYRALVLLVIACPCALVISTPVSIVSAIGAATRLGMLVKGGAALEEMARVRTVAFDKTGTITVGRPRVVSIVPTGRRSAADVLAIAAAVESRSEHPLARSVVARALHDAVTKPEVTSFAAIPGCGVVATIGGTDFAIGNGRLLAEYGVPDDELATVEARITRHGELGESVLTVVEIAGGSAHVIGTIAVADTVRVNAAEAIRGLHRSGVSSVTMLTGDRLAVAASIAAAAGVDDVRADLLPEDKVTAITALRARGPVAMVGDGINDGPALAVADVGIAMGIGGSDVALESADIALMRDDLAALPVLRGLATQTVRVIRQNVTLSMVTKVAALLLATLGFVNLWIAVLLDVGTSLIVTFNGLRLARFNSEYSGIADPPLTEAAAACGCGPEHNHDHGEESGIQQQAAD